MSGGAKFAVALIVILAIVGIVGLGLYVYKEVQKNTINTDLHKMSQEEMEAVDAELTGSITFDQPFNMLLLGSDARTDDPDMGARTDTIILVRVDATTNTISMVSIPRDTKVTIPGVGDAKFNAAYTYGGASGTIAAVKQLTGVDIDHYAEINFEGFVDLIDAIGGIDVMVEERIDDPDAGPVVIEEGMQHLDGEHAMIFARSRSYETGDFQRTTSQRLLIKAAVDKMLSMDPSEYPGLLEKISTCMNTDFTIQELLGLAQAFTDEPELKMYSAMVPSGTADIDGVSYVVVDEALLEEMMKLVDKGKNPAKLDYEDNTVKSSKEAEKQGIETIVNYGEETYGEYYDPYAYDETYYYEEEESYDTGEYEETTDEEPVEDGGEYVDEGEYYEE